MHFTVRTLLAGAADDRNRALSGADSFYVPENPAYTIVSSATDSVRFTVEQTLAQCLEGHIVSVSTFVDPEGRVMDWHVFGPVEGPGWGANAVGGALEIYRLGAFLNRAEWRTTAFGILDHVLDHGFIDYDTGFIQGYRHIPTDTMCLNYCHDSNWFCPGSMAKIGFQLLTFADVLHPNPRAARMRDVAIRCADWIHRNVASVPNGWFPRRCAPDGTLHKAAPGGDEDHFWQTSADGLFIVQLQAALTQRGLADYSSNVAARTETFVRAGGIFGSINHDTYDAHECVAYAVAFRTLRLAAEVLDDPALARFAHEACLAGLERFKMREDRNGVRTTGLLYMEESWDTAYLWENAEAALAYFEAATDTAEADPELSRRHELSGLTILRAIARHHHGPHGFLTEGVDWNNHVGRRHHIGQAEYGAIQYTEPFLNNQHITEPTLYYLDHLARIEGDAAERRWRDCESNLLAMV